MVRYFKIGEISRLFGIGTDTIRYYEELGVIHPVRGDNGYRLYSIRDIWQINVIRDLRALDFSVERIGEYLNNRSIATTLELLEEQQTAIHRELHRLKRQQENISRRLSAIRRSEEIQEGVIRVEHFPPRRCYEIPEGFRNDEEMDVLMQRLLRKDPERLYIIGSGHIGSRLSHKAVQEGRCTDYSGVFIIDEHGDAALSGGEYLCLSYHGSNEKNNRFAPMLLEYAAQNGCRPVGEILELLLVDIHESSHPNEYASELQLYVEPI